MDNKKNGIPKLRFPGFTGAWEQRKLGDVATFKQGVQVGLEKQYTEKAPGRERFIRIVDYTQKTEDIRYIDKIPNANYVDKNDVVVVRYGAAGFVGHGISGIIANNMFTVNPFENLDKTYLYTYIKQDKIRKYLNSNSGSSTMPAINFNIMKTLPIPCSSIVEQKRIAGFFQQLDTLIALHQRKLEHLQEQKKGLLQKMFPKNGKTVPEVRFPGFTDAWEQRKLGEEFKKVNERNNGEFGKDRWISVAKMYFQDPDKVTSNNIDTRTYVMRLGDIAFEGHPNNEFKFGRFVANDIGDGVVSELFPIYRHIRDYDNNYWKYAIHLERIMGPIFAKSITSSGNSSNKLAPKDLLRQSIFLPHLDEQKQIGYFFKQFDSLIALHQRKLEHLELMKKGLLQQMFV